MRIVFTVVAMIEILALDMAIGRLPVGTPDARKDFAFAIMIQGIGVIAAILAIAWRPQ